MDQPRSKFIEGDDPENRLVAFSVLATAIAALIASMHPFDAGSSPEDPSALIRFGWIISQSFWLILPGVLLGWLSISRQSRPLRLLSSVWIFAVPVLLALDAIAFGWMGRRFLSWSTLAVFAHWRSLWDYVTWTTVATIGLAIVAPMIVTVLARLVVRRIGIHRVPWRRVSARWAFAGLCLVSMVLALPATLNWNATRSWIHRHPSRNPLCSVHLISPRATSAGETVVTFAGQSVPPGEPSTSRGEAKQFRWLTVTPPNERAVDDDPDVLIAIVESMRTELVDPEIMPHLFQYAERGLWCRSHFSGGNATTHGMFSLFNGLDATWYESPVRFTPLINRLLRQGGYEIGFFAGHNQWRKFFMDGFVDPEHFDVFQITPSNGLSSDRQATQRASQFLGEPKSNRPPRVAVLYLYATHAIYHSYAEDQIFTPAADDRLLYPYTASARDAVWNRYRNSARTIDRFLSAVMREDRIVIVTGDHGEAFLEDGTIGHGTRISKVQNQTPAVVYVPGKKPRRIDQPTSHADLLPTLIDALQWQLNRPEWLDGKSLIDESPLLRERVFVTRDYLSDQVAWIGPWTIDPAQPFAFVGEYSPGESVGSGYPIDERGEPLDAPATGQ